MIAHNFRLLLLTCCLTVMACGPTVEESSSPDSANASEVTARGPATSREVRGWWDIGDSAGPFTAHFVDDQLVRIKENLQHGEYGSTRAEYVYTDGRLVRYIQESKLRMTDPSDPHRLASVSFEVEFDLGGNLAASSKNVDGLAVDLDPLDEDRIRGHARTLEEMALAFAVAYDSGEKRLRYLCDEDEAFEVVTFSDGVILDLGPFEGLFLLDHVPSASGAKYSDGRFTFWSKGTEAFVERFSERLLSNCTIDD